MYIVVNVLGRVLLNLEERFDVSPETLEGERSNYSEDQIRTNDGVDRGDPSFVHQCKAGY